MKKIVMFALLISLGACTTQRTPMSSRNINVRDYDMEDVYSLKEGKACENYILWFPLPNNNSSMVDAMKNGKINKVKMVDESVFYSIIWNRYCTIVYGK